MSCLACGFGQVTCGHSPQGILGECSFSIPAFTTPEGKWTGMLARRRGRHLGYPALKGRNSQHHSAGIKMLPLWGLGCSRRGAPRWWRACLARQTGRGIVKELLQQKIHYRVGGVHPRALQKAETGTSRSHRTGPLAAVEHSAVGADVGVQFPLRKGLCPCQAGDTETREQEQPFL